MRKRAALSEVISTVILAGVVLAIGGMLWSYSLGAATVIADNYVNDTLSLINEIVERFGVEHIHYLTTNDTLRVWIYNYGDVDVTLDVYVTAKATINKSNTNQLVLSGQIKRVSLDFSSDALTSGDDVVIKLYSRRQNVAYSSFIVP